MYQYSTPRINGAKYTRSINVTVTR